MVILNFCNLVLALYGISQQPIWQTVLVKQNYVRLCLKFKTLMTLVDCSGASLILGWMSTIEAFQLNEGYFIIV